MVIKLLTILLFVSTCFGQIQKQHLSVIAKKNSLGSDLTLGHGTFTTAADTLWWINSWGNNSFGSGVYHYTNSPDGNGIYKTSLLTAGKSYNITFTISNYVAGDLTLILGDTGTIICGITDNGTYTFIGATTGTTYPIIASVGSTTLDIDNVSIKEILNP